MKKLAQRSRVFFLSLSFLVFNYAIAQDKCEGSLLFDNMNTLVQLPLNNQYYTDANGGYTWECWFRLNQPLGNADRPLISAADAVQYEDMYLGFGWHGGAFNEPYTKLVFQVDGPGMAAPTGPYCSYMPSGGFLVGKWYYAVGVMDYPSQTAKLYVNGVLQSTMPANVTVNTRVIQTNLSACDACTPVNSVNANMDEVRIWSRPLSAAEIASNYRQCLIGNETNLLVYYRCNQVGAANVEDATSNSNDGTFLTPPSPGWSTLNAPVSGVACCAQKCEGSLLFDNTNTAVQLPLNNQYYTDTYGGYTWETWFMLNQPLGNADRPLISAADWVTYEDMYLGFGWHGGAFNEPYTNLVFQVDGPSMATPSGPYCSYAPLGGFVVGKWYYAAGVMDYPSQTAKLYVDGVLQSTMPANVSVNPRVIQTNLSACDACGPVNSVNANMDEVRIWSRPLTAAEIAANYNQCLIGNETNLLVYYRCNQVGASNVVDATSNLNNGTFLTPPSPGWSILNAPVSGAACCNRKGSDGGDGGDGHGDGKKTVGINKQTNQDAGLKIYPNPSSGSIKVSSVQPGVLTVYSVTGQVLSEIQVQKSEHEVKLEGYKPGIYLYVFTSGSSTSSGKLIIEN